MLKVIIPAAGHPKNELFPNTYDPLIPINGIPTAKYILNSLKNKNPYEVIFLIHKDDIKSNQFLSLLSKSYKFKIRIISIPNVTRGQAETVLKAKELINNYNKLLVFNADTFFISKNLSEILHNQRIDGAIAVFIDNTYTEKYSFVKVDKKFNVTEVAEKKRISNLASNGLYYFKYGKDFVKYAEDMISKNETVRNEFYVIPLYNKMLQDGKRVKAFVVDENWILGTPEELESFERNFKKEI